MDLHAHNLEPATIYQRISSFSGEVGNHQIPNFQKTKIHQNTHKTWNENKGGVKIIATNQTFSKPNVPLEGEGGRGPHAMISGPVSNTVVSTANFWWASTGRSIPERASKSRAEIYNIRTLDHNSCARNVICMLCCARAERALQDLHDQHRWTVSSTKKITQSAAPCWTSTNKTALSATTELNVHI